VEKRLSGEAARVSWQQRKRQRRRRQWEVSRARWLGGHSGIRSQAICGDCGESRRDAVVGALRNVGRDWPGEARAKSDGRRRYFFDRWKLGQRKRSDEDSGLGPSQL